MAMTEPSTSSGLLTVATTAVCVAPCVLTSIILNPAAAASSVVIYDNASAASGTVLGELLAVANGASVSQAFNSPILATKGLTVVVAGSGATATVSFARV